MGAPSQHPPGPITVQTIEGREQFRKLFKPWSRQWSQPALMKLAEAVLGDKVIHSSQLSGFSAGTLKDPAPKVLLALGLLNKRLANRQIPPGFSDLLDGKWVMRSPDGIVLGPAELFLVFTGELDLGLPDLKEIPQDKEDQVSRVFGRFIRIELAKKGLDLVEDQELLVQAAPAMKALIQGKSEKGEVIADSLPKISGLLGISEGELWDVIQQSHG